MPCCACCSLKCNENGKCYSPSPLCASVSECIGILESLPVNQTALDPFKDLSKLECAGAKASYGLPINEKACVFQCTSDDECATVGITIDKRKPWVCGTNGYCEQPCRYRRSCNLGEYCETDSQCSNGLFICENNVCVDRCDPDNKLGDCIEGEVCGTNLACKEKYCKRFDIDNFFR